MKQIIVLNPNGFKSRKSMTLRLSCDELLQLFFLLDVFKFPRWLYTINLKAMAWRAKTGNSETFTSL